MPRELNIAVDPERLDDGSPEERAGFGAVSVRYGEVSLTEGQDGFIRKVRSAALLSGYHLAEWLAWNWWRLRWEPRSRAPGWELAHHMASIGEGYVWPNITVFSDGERVALIAKPTRDRPTTPFRYLADIAAVVPGSEFEYVTTEFVEQVRGLLRENNIENSNLDRIWADVCGERQDPEMARRRKWEALLGYDPDDAKAGTVESLTVDAKTLGEPATNELAADYPQGGELLTLASLQALAEQDGVDASPQGSVHLAAGTGWPRYGDVPAWRLGAAAAQALREQESLDGTPISNERLAEMAGVGPEVLTSTGSASGISFALDNGSTTSRIVLRSKWVTGRRFELARLLGDRILAASQGPLFPATRAYTYRQKMQRSFAAELLCPFENLEAMLAGDYSEESQQEAADHFQASALTVRTLLVNHRRLEHEDLDYEIDVSAA